MSINVRLFEDRDYARLAEIEMAVDPTRAPSADLLRERDAMHGPPVRRLRLAANTDAGELAGVGLASHIWFNFNPRNFLMRVVVDPKWQRRGIGSALFDRLLTEIKSWDAALVRSETRDSQRRAIAFLEHHGFHEWRRRWESVLEIAEANAAPLARANQRASERGVIITTYAAELEKRGDRLKRDVWQLEHDIFRADPNNASEGEGMSFESFVAAELEFSEVLPEGHFLAFLGSQLVGVCRLARDRDRDGRLDQSFTGTHPDFRGLGIAQALKLHTIEFAREHGYGQIVTSNDSDNEPMLHINNAIGFRRDSAIIIFERKLAD